MKLGLLNIRPHYEGQSVPIFLPNGCDYLASYIGFHKPEWQTFVEYDPGSLLSKKPDIIGISSFTRTYTLARKISRELKKYTSAPIIIGGHHITALPEKLDENMDIGVIGEGEITLLDLLTLYEKEGFNPESLNQIDGLVFRDREGNFVRTRSRGLISDLDLLPFPYRTRVPNVNGYWQESIFTSRGCPFRCKYCAINEFWDKIRYHSPERVISELTELLAKKEVTSITIHDDLFGINKKRLLALVNAVRETGIHRKVSFTCNARASVFDEEIAQMFVDLNVKAVVFGMESANDRILSYMKGSTSAKQNQRALEICKKYNILAVPNFIFGFPTETQAEAADSYWFVNRNKKIITDFRIFPATPLPGTYLYDYATKNNLIKADFSDWEALDLNFMLGRSVYLNEQYSIQDYLNILGKMDQLKQRWPDFSVTSREQKEREVYVGDLSKLISSFGLKTKQRVLEINSLNYFLAEKSTNFYQSLPINNSDLDLTVFPENSFDLIFITHGLEYIKRDPADIFRQLKRICSFEGKILISVYNSRNLLFIMKILFQQDLYSSWGIYDSSMINHFSPEKFRKVIVGTGLVIEAEKSIFNSTQKTSFSEIEQTLEKFFPAEETNFPGDIFSTTFLLRRSDT